MQKTRTKWSTLRKLTLTLTLGVLATLVTQVATADVYTDPVGFITLTAVGTNGSPVAPAASVWGLGMTQIPTNRGYTTGASGLQISVNNALTPGAFNMVVTGAITNPTFFIEITSGSGAGVFDDIVSNDAVSVYTASDMSSLAASGTTYKIYPQWTIATVFGASNSSGLQGGTGSGNADNINVWNPLTQGFQTYYYKTNAAGGGIGWRSTATGTSANMANSPLYIDQGIQIVRRVGSTTNMLLVGAVKLGKTVLPAVASGSTFAANVYPNGVSLGASGLYTTNSATGIGGGTGSGNADNVNIWNPTTQGYVTYYFKTNAAGGGIGWRSTATGTSTDASTNQIPLGGSTVILRRLATPFDWGAPQPF